PSETAACRVTRHRQPRSSGGGRHGRGPLPRGFSRVSPGRSPRAALVGIRRDSGRISSAQPGDEAMHRRDFLAATACAAAASSLLADEGDVFPIIDTHQHLWDLKRFRLPWIQKGSPLARNYLLADYR